MRLTGTLTSWDAKAGFGIITVEGGQEDIFVDAAAGLQDPPPLVGELLAFEVEGRDGSKRAINILRLTHLGNAKSGLSLSDVDTSLEMRARTARQPIHRATPPRPARKIRTGWSFGRVLSTVIVVIVAALLAFTYRDQLRGLKLKDMDPSKIVPEKAEKKPPPPRERLTE